MIGTNARNRREAAQMINEKRYGELIREIPIKKGDFFQINPGCRHAIKGGTLILETQQSSDITYRVYDYGRLSNGIPRELHVEQSMDVIEAPFQTPGGQPVICNMKNVTKTCFVKCSYYQVFKYEVYGKYEETFNHDFVNVSVLNGSGTLNGIEIVKGMHFIIPHGYGVCYFEGEMSLICSVPGRERK